MASEWSTDRLDVAAYLRRIGYEGSLDATLQTLRGLHRAHLDAISFENLDVVIGRPVHIDIDSLQDKLIRRRRGGYCFEHNLLFGALLERVGFPVTRLAGRVHMGTDKLRPRTHMLLRVEAASTDWLADVGFGGEGLLEPLPLAAGATASQGSWSYRLDRRSESDSAEDTLMLQSLHRDGWFDLYSFTLAPQHHVDYVMANHYIATHPGSPFVGQSVVQRYGPDVRHVLVGRCLTTTRGDGSVNRRRLDPQELPQVLEDTFGIVLTPEERIRLQVPTSHDRDGP